MSAIADLQIQPALAEATSRLELQPLALLAHRPAPALLPPAKASPELISRPAKPAASASIERLLKPRLAANWGLDAAGQITCFWQSLP